MKAKLISIIILIAALFTACTGGNKVENPQFAFLDTLGITINEKLLLGDTLALPDIYCGDPQQQDGKVQGQPIDHDQYLALVVPAGKDFEDEMGNWLLLGVRDMDNGVTLAAYFTGSGVGYCVDLITYDRNGHVLDAVNARELHLVWRCDLSNPDDDNAFTLDSYITFDGADRMTLHRVMGRCLMDFENDLKGKPEWQQAWQQTYVIDAKGNFVLQGQQLADAQGKVDHYAVMDFRTWDMLVCSLHDTSIMDTWNDYCSQVEALYAPDYEFNPFPWDVTNLYKMNPQRFLRWMAAHGDQNNRLLRYFKLPPGDRPGLLKEIARLDDTGARTWLATVVNSWDDKPLTKHL